MEIFYVGRSAETLLQGKNIQCRIFNQCFVCKMITDLKVKTQLEFISRRQIYFSQLASSEAASAKEIKLVLK